MDIRAKLLHLLGHWIEHNEAHLQTYRDWADQASMGGLVEAARELEGAIRATESVNESMRRAQKTLRSAD